MSDLRVNSLRGRTAGSAPNLPDGAVSTGIITATTFDGNLTGDVTGNNVVVGIASASQFKGPDGNTAFFYGDGSGLINVIPSSTAGINIKNDEDFGRDAEAIVSAINGSEITAVNTTKNQRNNVFFETTADQVNVIVGEPHTFSDRDNVRVVVSGITTNNYTFLNETYPINVKNLTSALIEDIPDSGISTYVKVSDGLESLDLRVDDVIQIDNEQMKNELKDYLKNLSRGDSKTKIENAGDLFNDSSSSSFTSY